MKIRRSNRFLTKTTEDSGGNSAKNLSVAIKTLRIMQLSAVFILGFCLQVAAAGHAQKMTFSGKDVSLNKIFAEVKKQTGFKTIYDRNLVNNQTVSINAEDIPLQEFLDKVLSPLSMNYVIENKTIFVREKATQDLNQEIREKSFNPVVNPPITGIVRGPDGQPLAGVNIVVKGTKRGTVSGADGRFSIEAKEGEILMISSVGYNDRQITVGTTSTIGAISLSISESKLDEIQIIAYGTTSKRLNTGNVTTVKAEEIAKQPVNNPLLALEGRVPGLFIQQSSGFSGTGVSVQIQGPNSMINSNDPFYVVDGVPFTSQLVRNLGDVLKAPAGNGQWSGNPFSYINPNMIESIEVLKDADATAIYGSRAANGAILITTKKGKAGKPKVDFNFQSGVGKVTRRIDFLTPSQYFEMREEAYRNDGLPVPGPDMPVINKNINNYDLSVWNRDSIIDWQEELIENTTSFSDVQANISGGSDNIQYLIGTNYHRETTALSRDLNNQKKSLHFNLSGSAPNKKFSFTLSGSYLIDDNKLTAVDLTRYINYAPNHPRLLNADGSLNWAPTDFTPYTVYPHPLANLQNVYKNNTTNFLASGSLGYRVLPWITIRSNFGYTTLRSDELTTDPSINFPEPFRATYNRKSSYGHNYINTWILEPQIQMLKRMFGGTIDGLVGSTIQKKETSGEILQGSGYSTDAVMEDIGAAATILVDYTAGTTYRYNALFARLNYNFHDQYIINVQARRDGTSRYGAKNRFHNFWSIGGAWIFSNESILRNSSVISFGKLRASYGTTGSDQIPDYQYLRLYYNQNYEVPYNGGIGLLPFSHANPYLQWEETKKFSAGIDLGFWKDRLLLNATYFLNRSSNQLLTYSLPLSSGFQSVSANLPATVQNSGFEFTVNTANIKRKSFTWQTAINFTLPKNKLLRFDDLANSSDYAVLYEIGKSINITKAYKYSGVNTTTGLYQFLDREGNITSDPGYGFENRIVAIDPLPKYYGGIQNSFTYKQFSLDFLFQFTKQIAKTTFFGAMFDSGTPGLLPANQPPSVWNRWQKPGDDKPIQKYSRSLDAIKAFGFADGSDAVWGDASYIRLKNLSLSYNFPLSIISALKVQNLRMFAQGQNLLTITSYQGLDPETKSSSSLPPLRIITFGVQVIF